MEFPDMGKQCSVKTCQQLDFLPFTCQYCNLIFCKEHVQTDVHTCLHYKDNVALNQTNFVGYKCSQDLCNETTSVEIICEKCKNHFCIAHRHHGCSDIDQQMRQKDLEKWQKPKQDFTAAKEVVEEQVAKKLKKNSALANKVQLMRLKGRSVGQSDIPTSERRYFLIYYSVKSNTENCEKSKAVFVSIRWTIGKIIDYIADLLGIPNFNNTSTSKRLQIFHHSTDIEVSKQMDISLEELFKKGDLFDGQSLIIKHSNA